MQVDQQETWREWSVGAAWPPARSCVAFLVRDVAGVVGSDIRGGGQSVASRMGFESSVRPESSLVALLFKALQSLLWRSDSHRVVDQDHADVLQFGESCEDSNRVHDLGCLVSKSYRGL